MKIGSNIRTEPVQSAYPVSGVEPCGAAADDAYVERLCRGGGEAPRQALDKQRPQPHHRAGEEPQTAGHGGSAGDHTTGSRIWTQAGHGGGDVEARLPGGVDVEAASRRRRERRWGGNGLPRHGEGRTPVGRSGAGEGAAGPAAGWEGFGWSGRRRGGLEIGAVACGRIRPVRLCAGSWSSGGGGGRLA